MRIILLFALPVLIVSCKAKPSETSKDNTKDTTQFFQVAEFIKSQVADVNKTPFYIYKKTVEKGKTDSVQISNEQFSTLANQFIQPDITAPNLKKEYVETVFFDETTRSYTLNYSTKNKELEIQNLDVLLLENGETIKRIFIRKFINYDNDSSAIEQLSWKPNEQFQISRMVQTPNNGEITRQAIVVWNQKN